MQLIEWKRVNTAIKGKRGQVCLDITHVCGAIVGNAKPVAKRLDKLPLSPRPLVWCI